MHKSRKTLNTFMLWSVACLSLLAATGCTQFVTIQQPEVHSVVQRAAKERGAEFIDYFYAKESGVTIHAEDRVVWVAGVDLSKTRLQRSSERKAGDIFVNEAPLIKSYELEIIGSELSFHGRMVLNEFKAEKNDRFYVEFLSKGPMQEETVREPVDAWKKILPLLELNGLNPSGVVLGGAKYGQKINAIILVKIGD